MWQARSCVHCTLPLAAPEPPATSPYPTPLRRLPRPTHLSARTIAAKFNHSGAEHRGEPRGNHTATKSQLLMFSRHRYCGENSTETQDFSKNECRRGGEAGKKRRGGIEDRPAADIASDRAVKHGPGERRPAHHRHHAAAIF